MRTALRRCAQLTLGVSAASIGCGAKPQSADRVPEPSSSTAAFSSPTSVGACAPDRLLVLETAIDAGAPYASHDWLPVEYALRRHAHASENLVVLFVPEVDLRQHAQAIRALRFDVDRGAWLPSAHRELPLSRALAPPYAEISSGPVGAGYVLTWEDRVLGGKRGLFFDPALGTFRDASAAEVARVSARQGLETHASPAPGPDPTTGVSVGVSYPAQQATFSRGNATLGTVRFPTIPGAYVGVFTNTRTAFFWDHSPRDQRRKLPPSQQRMTYLVHLESGATCRVERDLVYPATAVFRRKAWIAFVNAHRNEVRPSDCPPGAPCVAPEQSHFERASLVVLRDRG